jgi:hypothetical protein
VSIPFDLQSAAMFDSHMPCYADAVPVPCHHHAVLKATSRGRGTAQHGHLYGMFELASAFQMWATCRRSASSGYHVEFHEGCYQKHTNLLTLSVRTEYIYSVASQAISPAPFKYLFNKYPY